MTLGCQTAYRRPVAFFLRIIGKGGMGGNEGIGGKGGNGGIGGSKYLSHFPYLPYLLHFPYLPHAVAVDEPCVLGTMNAMGILKEFKEFAAKGNVIDLAVGIIIGTAFGKIVSSLVNDLIMPPFMFLLGKVNFTDRFVVLSGDGTYATPAEAKAAGAVTLNYGNFLNAIIEFLIVGIVVFLLVKQINRVRRYLKENAPRLRKREEK